MCSSRSKARATGVSNLLLLDGSFRPLHLDPLDFHRERPGFLVAQHEATALTSSGFTAPASFTGLPNEVASNLPSWFGPLDQVIEHQLAYLAFLKSRPGSLALPPIIVK